MGLRDDMDVLQSYIDRGLGREYMEGTLTPEQRQGVAVDRNKMPSDPTSGMSMNSPGWIAARGD